MMRLFLMFLVLAGSGCSVRRFAVNQVGNALAGGGTVWASDDDPDLIRDAAPFSLKLMESLLAESPNHQKLLLATASGFTQYSYAFVQQEADEMEGRDLAAANELRARARRLYLRARNYGLRGLETRYRGIEAGLRQNPKEAVRRVKAKRDVPVVYWTAASWGAAISLSKNDPETVADVPVVEALIDRAAELDEAYEAGTLHVFLITYEMARKNATGDPVERARKHFDRAVELSQGLSASPFVSWAEQVSVQKQDRKDFVAMLQKALAVDVNARPEWRLQNLIMQRRARWLLSKVDELFAE